jgi:hypothetical protein
MFNKIPDVKSVPNPVSDGMGAMGIDEDTQGKLGALMKMKMGKERGFLYCDIFSLICAAALFAVITFLGTPTWDQDVLDLVYDGWKTKVVTDFWMQEDPTCPKGYSTVTSTF